MVSLRPDEQRMTRDGTGWSRRSWNATWMQSGVYNFERPLHTPHTQCASVSSQAASSGPEWRGFAVSRCGMGSAIDCDRTHHSDHPIAHDGVVDGQAHGVGQQETMHFLQRLTRNARGMDVGLPERGVRLCARAYPLPSASHLEDHDPQSAQSAGHICGRAPVSAAAGG
jgi:hypothetical protein